MFAKVVVKRTPPFRLVFSRGFYLNATVLNNKPIEIISDDPVQQIFHAKLNEYRKKCKNGKMVDPKPEMIAEFKKELERINKQYGGDGKTDLTKFPEFKFPEVQIDPLIMETKKNEN